MPADLVEVLPRLRAAAALAARTQNVPAPIGSVDVAGVIGELYRRPDESVMIAQEDPFARDPALVEGGLRSHAATQNALADYLTQRRMDPRSPAADEPNFDLAWFDGEVLNIAEVKSIRPENEERQLRLGVGQVLRYRQQMRHAAVQVEGVVVTSQEPVDGSWIDLFDSLGLGLVWPGTFDTIG